MKNRTRLLVATTAALIALAACGSDSKSATTTTTQAPATAAPTTSVAPSTTQAPTTTQTPTTLATTTTHAPTTTEPPTTTAPTPEQLYMAAAKVQVPSMYKSNLGDKDPHYMLDIGHKVCDEAINGYPKWGDHTNLTGAQALAWIAEVGLDHESARISRLAIQYLCPENQPVLDEALTIAPPPPDTDYYEGVYLVGTEIQPGVYEATGDLSDCYWERQDASGGIIANNFITAAKRAQVTIRKSDYAFMTEGGCGGWAKVG